MRGYVKVCLLGHSHIYESKCEFFSVFFPDQEFAADLFSESFIYSTGAY